MAATKKTNPKTDTTPQAAEAKKKDGRSDRRKATYAVMTQEKDGSWKDEKSGFGKPSEASNYVQDHVRGKRFRVISIRQEGEVQVEKVEKVTVV